MKTNAIIRIILYSVIILILLGILFAGLGFSLYSFDAETAHEGQLVEGIADRKDIRKLKISWVAGNITIQPDENATDITFYETGSTNEKNRMVYTVRGNTLEIDDSSESVTFPSIGFTSDAAKDLTITVPADWVCVELELDVADTNVMVRDLVIQDVDLDGASGTCVFVLCNVTNMELDTASGDVQFSGTLQALDFDAASASFLGVLTNVPQAIDMDSASGDLDLTLPADAGFTARVEGLSSDFTSDFPTQLKGGRHVAGDGACMIDVDGMSCDVIIRKG